MVSPRTRRLAKELHEMQELAKQSSLVDVDAEGSAPVSYSVTLYCRGLCFEQGEVSYTSQHRFDIHLGHDFPAESPSIVWKTPIFHPNFRGGSICLGTHWDAGGTLAELCVTICEMVQYKQFNIYDPLNHEAALWLVGLLDHSPEKIPTDDRCVRDLQFEFGTIHRREAEDGGES